EPHPLRRHPVEPGRLNDLLSVTAQIAVPQIVGHDEDDVRPTRLIRLNGRRHSEEDNHQEDGPQPPAGRRALKLALLSHNSTAMDLAIDVKQEGPRMTRIGRIFAVVIPAEVSRKNPLSPARSASS